MNICSPGWMINKKSNPIENNELKCSSGWMRFERWWWPQLAAAAMGSIWLKHPVWCTIYKPASQPTKLTYQPKFKRIKPTEHDKTKPTKKNNQTINQPCLVSGSLTPVDETWLMWLWLLMMVKLGACCLSYSMEMLVTSIDSWGS